MPLETFAGAPGRADEAVTLETVRRLAARNEALLSMIQLDYTVQILSSETAPGPAGKRGPGRPFAWIDASWARRGAQQYLKETAFYGPNEPALNTETISDERIRTEVQLPGRRRATLSDPNPDDYARTLPGRLEMRLGPGQYALADLLVPEHARLHPGTEMAGDRSAYVLDVSRPLLDSAGTRIWLDCEAGVPIRVRRFDRHPTIPGAQVTHEVNDVRLHRLANGGWIPVAGLRTVDSGAYRSRTRILVDANSVKVGAEVPESLFQVRLPSGAAVYDARSGTTSSVGQPAKTYEQITESGGRFLAGTVVAEHGVPVPQAVVTAPVVITQRQDGSTGLQLLATQPCAVTDGQGRFALELPEEGSYDLVFRHPDFACRALLRVPAGERHVNVTLDLGGIITGRVVRMVNGHKAPVANVDVYAFAPDAPALRGGQLHAVADARGRFEFRGLDASRDRPRFGREQESRYVPISWRIYCGRALATVQFEKGVHTQEVELLLRPDPAAAPSPVGRELPRLADLGISLRLEDMKGKMVLVCFFDLEQRPARRYVEELAGKAQVLKDKGMVVLAVQAAETSPAALATWRQQSQVPFEVGMMRQDIPEQRYAWSVRSLPWPILVGRDGLVRAEGFALDELDTLTRQEK
jgi:hypothetical protein